MIKTFFNKTSLLIAAFSLLFFALEAKHIIGGTMSYKYLGISFSGNPTYEISLILVRDCNPATGGATFDSPAEIALYRGTPAFNSLVFSGTGYPEVIDSGFANVPLPVFDQFNACQDVGRYTVFFELPALSAGESYFFVYQRCCKSGDFVNVADPENTGLTLSIELTAAAMALENNAPMFTNPTSVVACALDSLVMDRSATDADGDTLYYHLSAGVNGGGSDLGSSDCTGVLPSPPCPPPFADVVFAGAPFSTNNPLGAVNPMQVNVNTGQLSNFPHLQGVFLVGMNVDEFRDGVRLSTVHSEFGVYVIDCAVDTNTPFSSESVVLSPNPASGQFTVSVKSADWGGATYALKNMQGVSLLSGKLAGEASVITLAGLPAGIYLLELQSTEGKRMVKKLEIN